jgi:hypothetical protein
VPRFDSIWRSCCSHWPRTSLLLGLPRIRTVQLSRCRAVRRSVTLPLRSTRSGSLFYGERKSVELVVA